MLPNWVIIVAALGYIGLLFVIASYGDHVRRLQRGRLSILIYPLSLAIYCTSWTFFGSVGVATRSGFEFLAIYIGPIIMIGLCTPLLSRIIRIAKTQNITSIADFIAARYGKSPAVAATVALIAIIGSIPYIALQLKAVASSLQTVLAQLSPAGSGELPVVGDLALMVTVAMATFAVLFGTRHTDATEHQNGLMLAIATESIVKLIAFLTVGIFVTFWMFDGFGDLLVNAQTNLVASRALEQPPALSNFLAMGMLAFFAIVLLPRQFHVSVVENYADTEVRRARWMFPLYLIAINLFVMPIALAGLITFPASSVDSDMFVLALPLAGGSPLITVITFIGGLSAATAMIIVESVALAIMVSNDLVVPLMLRGRSAGFGEGKNFGHLLLKIRRVAIFVMLLFGYLYYRSSGGAQLASIGLLSFAAVAQFAPAFFGGLFWRRATSAGAIAGMAAGFAVWGYTLFLPTFADAGFISQSVLLHGPAGIGVLRPNALFGLSLPPLVHGVVWSLILNSLAYVFVSLLREPSSIERLQADVFVPSGLAPMTPNFRMWRSSITVQDLLSMVGQYLGPERTRQSFEAFANARGLRIEPSASADFQLLQHAEHLIASTIGAASSRLVLSLLLRKRAVSPKAALKLLDNAHAALHYNREILQTALNHVRQGIAVFNQDLQLICFNRQFGDILALPTHMTQIGIGLDEILLSLSPEVPSPANPDPAFLNQRLALYTAAGGPFLERFPGRNLVIEVRSNRMPDGGYVITFSDITPSVEAAEALERANATLERRVRERTEELMHLNAELEQAKSAAEDANLSKTRFLAAASHDILQPLNAARLYVTSLVERQAGGDDSHLVHNIDDSLEAIEEIIGALLDISRLDAGAMIPTLSNFRISDLMRTLEIEFTPMAQEKHVELVFVPCSLPIKSDRALFRRLLQNLISNAIKYTPNGKVLVGCRRHAGRLQIDVYDTGLGIPASKRKEIFKEFHRLDQGAKIARGLGLGLSIVERIARVLNHPIAVRSNRTKGSHFSVRVPIAEAMVHPAAISSENRTAKTSMAGAVIVCIDNEPTILDGMRTLLTGWGATVITATDPASAIELIAAGKARPTGLLVDYHLDHGTGLAAIRQIRARFGDTIPAALITADRSPSVRETARIEDIPIANKPVKPAALRALLAQWRSLQAVAAE
ncbi:MAG: hybrid sensor histidine kinase/response regulator [Xanthobacteraceae bacterium]|nr:MAG: hybrid sensor histidine kinase/response regulator [Xanthobacteraceae bacterium]